MQDPGWFLRCDGYNVLEESALEARLSWACTTPAALWPRCYVAGLDPDRCWDRAGDADKGRGDGHTHWSCCDGRRDAGGAGVTGAPFLTAHGEMARADGLTAFVLKRMAPPKKARSRP
jgi:hypothetical protein